MAISKYLNIQLDGKAIKDTRDLFESAFGSVETDINSINNNINTNQSDIENKLQDHKDSITAHNLEDITYAGDVTGASNGKQALDLLQAQLNTLILGGTESDPRVSQALVDSEGTTHNTLKDRLDNELARIENLENEVYKPDYTEELEQTATIFSAGTGTNKDGIYINESSSIEEGQFSDVVLKGNTYTNILGTMDTSTNINLATANTTLYFHPDGTIKTVSTGRKLFSIQAGRKYLIKVKMKPTSLDVTLLRIFDGSLVNVATNTGKELIGIHTATNTIDSAFIDIKNSVVGDVIFDHAFVYDITDETETDLNKLNAKYTYVSNTKSTLPIAIKSIGTNLARESIIKPVSPYIPATWNGEKIYLDNNSNTSDRARGQIYVKLKNGEEYAVKKYNENIIAGSNALLVITEIGKYITLKSISDNSSFIWNLPTGYYALNVFTDKNTLQQIELNIMLNKGNISQLYEPYQESEVYLPPIGRSLPNGTKDEINVSEGVHYKRVSDDVILDGSYVENIINTANTTSAYTTIFEDANLNGYRIEGIEGCDYSSKDNVDNIGKVSVNVNNNRLYFIRPLGESLADSKAFVDSILPSLIYQLAEEIRTPIEVEGVPYCFGVGTQVEITAYHKKEHIYNNGVTFPHPIKEIEKIKMLVDGELKEIANAVTLAADGLSTTIDGVVNGEVVTIYAPYKDGYSTTPTVKHKVNLNKSALMHSNAAMGLKNSKDIVDLKDKVDILILLNS